MKLEVGKTYVRKDFEYISTIKEIKEGVVFYTTKYFSSNREHNTIMSRNTESFVKDYSELTPLMETLF